MQSVGNRGIINKDMKKIFTYFKPYKRQTLLGPLFKLLEAAFELLVPFVVAAIVAILLNLTLPKEQKK